MIETAKVGTTTETETVIKYTDVSVATNRFTLDSGRIRVQFFDNDEGEFEAEFKDGEIVTDNLTMELIIENLTETSFGGWHTILEVCDIIVEQVFITTRTHSNGHIEEFEETEIVVDEWEVIPSNLKEVA